MFRPWLKYLYSDSMGATCLCADLSSGLHLKEGLIPSNQLLISITLACQATVLIKYVIYPCLFNTALLHLIDIN